MSKICSWVWSKLMKSRSERVSWWEKVFDIHASGNRNLSFNSFTAPIIDYSNNLVESFQPNIGVDQFSSTLFTFVTVLCLFLIPFFPKKHSRKTKNQLNHCDDHVDSVYMNVFSHQASFSPHSSDGDLRNWKHAEKFKLAA